MYICIIFKCFRTIPAIYYDKNLSKRKLRKSVHKQIYYAGQFIVFLMKM